MCGSPTIYVVFKAVDLTDIYPPEELEDALNAVINAQTESEELLARTEAECEQRILSAKQSLEIAKNNAQAHAIEIIKLGSYLERLSQLGVLDQYVSRRKFEVLSESKTVYYHT